MTLRERRKKVNNKSAKKVDTANKKFMAEENDKENITYAQGGRIVKNQQMFGFGTKGESIASKGAY